MSLSTAAGPVDASQSPWTLLQPLSYVDLAVTGGFWAQVQALNRSTSLAHGYAMLEKAGNLANLRIAAGQAEGDFTGFWFADSDVYKWLEAMAWELGRAPDATLQGMADEAIGLIQAAQQSNGYLNSYFQVVKPNQVWTDLDHGHELYCAGHLMQAAVAFQRALDDDRLMAVVLRFVDHIAARFGPGQRNETCGHPEIEMALVELYRVTRDERHLELAQLFVDRRGQNRMRGHAGYGPVYQQDHVPVREATEVAGHAVRQLYLTTAMADLYLERGEDALRSAMDRLWTDMTERKLYLTGGIGSRFDGEAFGGPYELPTDTCYCETCAAIASIYWNWRLLLMTGDSRYADLIERTLYNGVLCSPSLTGDRYLYVNPLLVRGGRYVRASADTGTSDASLRPAWHACACCPPNVTRLFSSLSHYLATTSDVGVQIHQFATMRIAATLQRTPVVLEMETDYPWSGKIAVHVREGGDAPWTLALRLPNWCPAYTLVINGETLAEPGVEQGYVRLTRAWQAGDRIEFRLEMPARFTAPHPRVDAIRGCVAVERGPLVYCLESHDQTESVDLLDVQVDPAQPPRLASSPLQPDMVALELSGARPVNPRAATLYRPTETLIQPQIEAVTLTAIPYFAWGNRGMESMRVWIPRAVA